MKLKTSSGCDLAHISNLKLIYYTGQVVILEAKFD